jgi:hypothetical protein
MRLVALFGALAMGPASAQRVTKPPVVEPPTHFDTHVDMHPDTRLDSGLGRNTGTNLNTSQSVNTSTAPAAASSISPSDGGNPTGSSDGTQAADASGGPNPVDQTIDDYLNQAGASFIDSLPIYGKLRHVY